MVYIGGMITQKELDLEDCITKNISELKYHHGQFTFAFFKGEIYNSGEVSKEKVRDAMIARGFVSQPKENVDSYWLLDKGVNFTTFENQRERDNLDQKLKSITLKSIASNKMIAVVGILIAAITAGVPYIIYKVSKDDIQKIETSIPQLQRVQQNQEQTVKMLQECLDSLKILGKAKSQSDAPAKKNP